MSIKQLIDISLFSSNPVKYYTIYTGRRWEWFAQKELSFGIKFVANPPEKSKYWKSFSSFISEVIYPVIEERLTDNNFCTSVIDEVIESIFYVWRHDKIDKKGLNLPSPFWLLNRNMLRYTVSVYRKDQESPFFDLKIHRASFTSEMVSSLYGISSINQWNDVTEMFNKYGLHIPTKKALKVLFSYGGFYYHINHNLMYKIIKCNAYNKFREELIDEYDKFQNLSSIKSSCINDLPETMMYIKKRELYKKGLYKYEYSYWSEMQRYYDAFYEVYKDKQENLKYILAFMFNINRTLLNDVIFLY